MSTKQAIIKIGKHRYDADSSLAYYTLHFWESFALRYASCHSKYLNATSKALLQLELAYDTLLMQAMKKRLSGEVAGSSVRFADVPKRRAGGTVSL